MTAVPPAESAGGVDVPERTCTDPGDRPVVRQSCSDVGGAIWIVVAEYDQGYRAVVDPSCLGLNIHAIVRLRTTHAKITAALDHFAQLPEITNLYRLTGEDCFLIDIHAKDAARLEMVVDTIARFGPVTTSLVLRTYPPKPITPR